MTTKPTIGFLGLGTMGGQMARRLVSEGYAVTGYDVDPVRAGQAKARTG
jgi:3-hydroxyisobutyrate dehydrogenase-like beta-hydroxyacid dehydrogenase